MVLTLAWRWWSSYAMTYHSGRTHERDSARSVTTGSPYTDCPIYRLPKSMSRTSIMSSLRPCPCMSSPKKGLTATSTTSPISP